MIMLPRFKARQSLAAGVGAVCFPTTKLDSLSLTRVFRAPAVCDQPGPLGAVRAGPNPRPLRPVPAIAVSPPARGRARGRAREPGQR